MAKYITLRLPFDVERAKKITNGDEAGRIVTRDGRAARILAFDLEACKHIVAAIRDEGKDWGETIEQYYDDGRLTDGARSDYDLMLGVPTDYPDYTNFRPTKYQPCIVRDNGSWVVSVCMGYMNDDEYGMLPLWINGDVKIAANTFEAVPLTSKTEPLIGKKIAYKDFVKQQYDKNI